MPDMTEQMTPTPEPWPDQSEVLGREAMLSLPRDGATPVGTILAYAGRFAPDTFKESGWYPCHGDRVSTIGEFAELFEAIGFAFGKTSPTEFRLPDLRGWFQRATTATSHLRQARDPDWEARLPPVDIAPMVSAPSAPAGVGSTQGYATARPRIPFTASADRLDITKESDDAGCAERPGKYNDDTISFPTTGGDLETRPVNKYVEYLIKVHSSTSSTPVGSLVPFAGQLAPSAPATPTWRVCHGDPVTTFDAAELFDALGFIHGQASENEFVLPDYRGWFHRGVAGESREDPNAGTREHAYPKGPEGHQGNEGNNVGSAQPWATGAPKNEFSTSVKHLPISDESKRVAGFAYNLLRRSGGSRSFDLSTGGGDSESRPANMSVDWYILSEDRPPHPSFPIGGVAAMACTLDANDWWIPCDGRTLLVREFEDLHTAIGTTYGGGGESFQLPDYGGRFLRGASYSSGIDPEADKRVAQSGVPTGGVGTFQDWATGRPATNPFRGDIPNYPDSDLGAHGVTNGGNARSNGALTFNTCTEGGDPETHPRNTYLNFYIRAKSG